MLSIDSYDIIDNSFLDVFCLKEDYYFNSESSLKDMVWFFIFEGVYYPSTVAVISDGSSLLLLSPKLLSSSISLSSSNKAF